MGEALMTIFVLLFGAILGFIALVGVFLAIEFLQKTD